MAVTKQKILNRFYMVSGMMLVFVFAIVFKLTEIQWLEGTQYREEAIENTIKQFQIPANRGNIYTADGSLLATSVPKYDIRMDVVTVPNKIFNRDIFKLSEALSEMFGKPASHYSSYLRNARSHNNKYLFIARDLNYSQYERIKRFPILKLGAYKGGLIVNQRTVRGHPLGKIAVRTIGYDDSHGTAGLEGSFSSYLVGKKGRHLKQKIAKGQWKPLNDDKQIDPKDGLDVITTLDLNIQDIAHHALLEQLEKFEAEHGSVVVMDVKTGEIKAISNLARTSKGTYFEKRNYAVYEAHEPGSTFKLMSMVVALDDKFIDTSTVIDTKKGVISFYGKKIRDSHRGGYGKITVSRVFELSSNVGMAKIIYKNYNKNPQRFVDKLYAMHVGKKLGIPIKGEGAPKIPNPKNKKEWNGLSLPWMAWGYGVKLTDLQMLTFYNAIANNGKMMKPQFVKQIKKQDKVIKVFKSEVINKKICSQNTIDKVKVLMENVVKRGTASNIYSPYFSMAGKTGTCQVDYWKGGETQYISSFVGYFPADNPKYSCIVVIHKPNKKIGYYGATVAAPAFKKIAQKIYTDTPIRNELKQFNNADKILEKQLTNDDKPKVKKYKYIPNVKKMTGMDAIALLENLGLDVRCEGSGRVAFQSIKPGENLKKYKSIYLKLL
ncbi:MAG: transpeptidase family protein [Flavobacteriaceae bacterium]|nr:transpeptidase family protein [Flavobacteriaceae bacterium]